MTPETKPTHDSLRPALDRLEREKGALEVHRASLRGSTLPRPAVAPRGTFLHGFLLPFSLIVATLRDRTLRGPYLRTFAIRAVVVAIAGTLVFATNKAPKKKITSDKGVAVVVAQAGEKHQPLHVHGPGVNVDIDGDNEPVVEVLGQKIPVYDPQGNRLDVPKADPAKEAKDAATDATPPKPLTWWQRAALAIANGWTWVVALAAVLSATEGVIVFFTRRYDDWVGFHAARLAGIKPEDESPKSARIALDLKWLYKKLRRRIRGYVVFAAGLPILFPIKFFPTVGPYVFSLALMVWGWYWLGVFSAAKSAHAWIDEGRVGSPAIIRGFNERVSAGTLRAPLRWYGRLWARVSRGLDPPATTFDRTPAPFLGLALARAILALPGLYLLARPIVPVAAGRLCAESDPYDRFSSVETGANKTHEGVDEAAEESNCSPPSADSHTRG